MIGYIMPPGKGDADLLLYGLARELCRRGHRPCGIVQINTPRDCDSRCDMDAGILPDGPVFRISQNLGVASRGCRLDTSALETSVGLVGAQLDKGAGLLIINKFGKQEAAGRGFRDVIGKAVSLGIPVLVGVNALNEPAFQEFAGSYARKIAACPDALLSWCEDILHTAPPVDMPCGSPDTREPHFLWP